MAEYSRALPVVTHDHLDATASIIMVVLCLCWAVQQVAVKVALGGGLPPFWQAGFRSAGATLLLLCWAAWRGDRRLWRLHDGTLGAGLLTAALFTAEVLSLFVGLAHTTAARSVLFFYTAPFVVAISAHIFVPGERLRLIHVAGLVVAFVGVAAAVADGLVAPPDQQTLIGDLLTLTAAVFWGASTVVIKASALARASATKVTLYQLAGSAPVLLVCALLLPLAPLHPTPLAGIALFYQTAGVAFVSYVVWFFLMTRYPAGKLAVFSCLTPPFGAAAGALLLGEPISPMFAVSILLVAGGIWLVNAAPRRRDQAARP